MLRHRRRAPAEDSSDDEEDESEDAEDEEPEEQSQGEDEDEEETMDDRQQQHQQQHDHDGAAASSAAAAGPAEEPGKGLGQKETTASAGHRPRKRTAGDSGTGRGKRGRGRGRAAAAAAPVHCIVCSKSYRTPLDLLWHQTSQHVPRSDGRRIPPGPCLPCASMSTANRILLGSVCDRQRPCSNCVKLGTEERCSKRVRHTARESLTYRRNMTAGVLQASSIVRTPAWEVETQAMMTSRVLSQDIAGLARMSAQNAQIGTLPSSGLLRALEQETARLAVLEEGRGLEPRLLLSGYIAAGLFSGSPVPSPNPNLLPSPPSNSPPPSAPSPPALKE